MNEIYSTLLRTLLKLAAGALITKGVIDSDHAEQALSAILTLLSIGWGVASAARAKAQRETLSGSAPVVAAPSGGVPPGQRGHVRLSLLLLIAGVSLLGALLFAGCASAKNEVTMEEITQTTETNGVVVVNTKRQSTKTDGHTLFDGKNTIANLRAGQTAKSQQIGVTGQSQESTSDVIKAAGEQFKDAVQLGAATAIKAVLPVK